MSSRRVLVDGPPFPIDLARELLDELGVAVEAPPRPWRGAGIVGLVTWDPVNEGDFAGLPDLVVVATPSVGFDHVDVAAARTRGVRVCAVPDYCVEEMADSTVALLLGLLRGTVALDRDVQRGGWDDHAAGPLRRVAGTRLGLVGFGRIGRAVAGRALALGIDVSASDPLVPDEEVAAAGVSPQPLSELLATCDALSLHAPLTPETAGLIGRDEFAAMPPGAVLVNTARAGLLDWDAFLEALDSGQLAAAALDVLPTEPPTDTDPAPHRPNLVVTPHAAWYSPEAEDAVYRRTALAVRDALQGREPKGAVV